MGERIQKVLFPVRKKRVQFSSERSLHASKLPGSIGRQGSSILRFVRFISDLFYKRPLSSARASKPRAPVTVNLGLPLGKICQNSKYRKMRRRWVKSPSCTFSCKIRDRKSTRLNSSH